VERSAGIDWPENGCKKDTSVYFRISLPTVATKVNLSDCSQGIRSFGEQPIYVDRSYFYLKVNVE
jgi:hypothetical protein